MRGESRRVGARAGRVGAVAAPAPAPQRRPPRARARARTVDVAVPAAPDLGRRKHAALAAHVAKRALAAAVRAAAAHARDTRHRAARAPRNRARLLARVLAHGVRLRVGARAAGAREGARRTTAVGGSGGRKTRAARARLARRRRRRPQAPPAHSRARGGAAPRDAPGGRSSPAARAPWRRGRGAQAPSAPRAAAASQPPRRSARCAQLRWGAPRQTSLRQETLRQETSEGAGGQCTSCGVRWRRRPKKLKAREKIASVFPFGVQPPPSVLLHYQEGASACRSLPTLRDYLVTLPCVLQSFECPRFFARRCFTSAPPLPRRAPAMVVLSIALVTRSGRGAFLAPRWRGVVALCACGM